MEKKTRVHTIIHGRVQGVFFRMETKRAAKKYGVAGWVRNKRDGTVEALFEGDEHQVDMMLEWCKTGPPLAKVEKLDINGQAYTGEFHQFDVVY